MAVIGRKPASDRTARDVLVERAKMMFRLYYAPGTCAPATHISGSGAGLAAGRRIGRTADNRFVENEEVEPGEAIGVGGGFLVLGRAGPGVPIRRLVARLTRRRSIMPGVRGYFVG